MVFFQGSRLLCHIFITAKISIAVDSTPDWSSLNRSVQGRLDTGTPLALPCFSRFNGHAVQNDPNACAALQRNYTSSTLRAATYGGFMNSQNEICASNTTDQCLLDNKKPLDPLAYGNKSCNQGSVSPYYINIQSPQDVIEAFSFSKSTGAKLSIKSSGHDYLGRSSLKGSLALWVRNLRTLSHDPRFIPEGCSPRSASYNTITTGAGVNFDEVYAYADQENVTFIGGYANSVAVSGGWVQGGGHSVLSPVYGLGIDRVIQFKIVTPDGVLRIANSCQHQDLFWALRGGGGGTFGVVLESTHKVEPRLDLVVASINFTQTASNAIPFLQLLVDNAVNWAQEGWGGHLGSHNLINVTPLFSIPEAKESFKDITAYALSQNGTAIFESLSWYAFYTKYVVPNQVPVGEGRLLSTRLFPTALFLQPEGRAKIMSFFQEIVNLGMAPYIPVVSPYLYHHPENSTSSTPAWRTSLWEIGLSVAWAWNSTAEEKRAVVAESKRLMEMEEGLTPGSGTYMNEASPWTMDWQEAFWGENYGRLVEIKRKYDPDGLLGCWKCVGFDEESEGEAFGCYEGLG